MDRAIASYSLAVRLAADTFLAVYDAETAVRYRLGLAVAYIESGEEGRGEEELRAAIEMAPLLDLDPARYSPKVREIYERVRKLVPPRPATLPATMLARIGSAVAAAGALVVGAERLGASESLRISVFDARAGRYVAIESCLLGPDPEERRIALHDLVERLRPALRRIEPRIPAPPPATVPTTGPAPETGSTSGPVGPETGPRPLPKPWWRRPWIWIAAGVLVAGAVVGASAAWAERTETVTLIIPDGPE
jgi:hypothetical protein